MTIDNKILMGVIALLFSIIVYFTKKIFDNTDSISKDVSEMKPKVEILWRDKYAPANSPRQLNDKGNEILNNSGIKEIVDEKKDFLFSVVKNAKPKTPYDAERLIEDAMSTLPELCPDVVDKLKDGAFKTGTDLGSLLYVGSIYLRNEIFPELGFSLTDLDQLPRIPKTE